MSSSITRRAVLQSLSLAAASGLFSCRRTTADPQSLVVLVPSEPDKIDPRYTRDALSSTLSRLVFAGLYDSDPVTFELIPSLAEGPPQYDPKSLEITVHLRTDARFHDGSPVRGQDVAATFSSILDPNAKSLNRGTFAKVFRAVRAVSTSTVVFELVRPDGTWPSLLQQTILREQDARGAEVTPAIPRAVIGSGPARLVSAERGVWDFEALSPTPHEPRRVRFVTVRDPNTLALRILHGQADTAEIKPELFSVFSDRAGFGLRSVASVAFTYLGLRHEHPLLAQRAVRESIALALDRASLLQGKFGRYAKASTGPLAPSHWAYTNDVAQYPFDLAVARRGLAPFQSHRSLLLRVSNSRFIVTIAQAVAEMLRAVDLDIQVKSSDQPTLLADLRYGRYDLCLLTMPDLSDPWGMEWLFASSAIPTKDNGFEGGNRWRFRNEEYDTFVAQGRQASGHEARAPFYQAAQRVFARELPVIPLWHADLVYAVGPRVDGLTPRPDAQLNFLLHAGFDGTRRV